jgi:hypothetical protein
MNRLFKRVTTVAALATFATLPCAAATLDEVVAKHKAAKGGDAWAKIENLKLTGSYTAFSETHPFTMHRAQGNKLRIETVVLGGPAITGYDGETAWSSQGQGPQEIEGLDRAIFIRDADFATPLFDYAERGYEAELIGETEFDGMPAIGIKLMRGDEHEETWYLDPESYLEMGRESPGNDWLGPVPRTTFYDDFREVAGAQIPHYVQSQWYTRDRVFEIDAIEANVEIDARQFGMPLPPGMGPLASLTGSWDVAIQQRQQPGQDWQKSDRSSTIESRLRGGLLEETYTVGRGTPVVRSISYDQFHETYRITQIDGNRTQLNVMEGTLGEDGKLVVSNADTGTTRSQMGMTFHTRITIYDVAADGFKMDYETSIDGGESWFTNAQAEYTRSAEQ